MRFSQLPAEADEIDTDKLKTAPADLSKLSNVVDNDIVKKAIHDKQFTKVNAVDASKLVSKAQYG